MKGPPQGPGGEDMTWPDQVAPRGRKASSTRKIKPQTSNPLESVLKGGLSHRYVGLMPRVLHSPPKTFHGGTNSRPLNCLK